MNDRYLYRAKRTDNGEWVEGFLARYDERFEVANIVSNEILIPVISSTICKCTGLKDKNRSLIFENDIIRYEGMLFVVKWNDACAHFAAYKVRERTRCTPVMNSGTMKITEVIGNIFDNPDLLEVGE